MKNILFDMDGVLVDYQPDIRFSHIAKAVQRSTSKVRAAIYDTGIEADADAGRLGPAEYLDALAKAMDAELPENVWTEARRLATQARLGLITRIESLASQDVGLAILTNNGRLLATHWDEIVPALFPLFHGRAHVAAEFGVAKPNPEVYLRALERLGWRPQDTLFIDDVQANVYGAMVAGLTGRCCNSEASVVDALVNFIGALPPSTLQ